MTLISPAAVFHTNDGGDAGVRLREPELLVREGFVVVGATIDGPVDSWVRVRAELSDDAAEVVDIDAMNQRRSGDRVWLTLRGAEPGGSIRLWAAAGDASHGLMVELSGVDST